MNDSTYLFQALIDRLTRPELQKIKDMADLRLRLIAKTNRDREPAWAIQGLTVRTENVLKTLASYGDVRDKDTRPCSIAEVAAFGEAALLRQPQMGRKALANLREQMAKLDVKLAP